MINKKIVTLLLLVSLIIQFGNVIAVKADVVTDADFEFYSYALKLAEIGVLEGTGNGFALESELTRTEGLIILIRLIGKKEEALALSDEESPFTDVPDWANGYVNYAYQEGLTEGVGNDKFGANDVMLAKSFTTLMLRSLGYDDNNGDFDWAVANDFGKEIGLIEDDLFDQLVNEKFLRNQAVKLSYNTLVTDMKVMNKSNLKTLGQHLVDLGIIDVTRARSIEIVEKVILPTPLLGPPTVTKEQLATWARQKGMNDVGIDLIDVYYEICQEKGLNPVIQYVQMCLETGWLYKVKSQAGIDATYHNPCGLKTPEGGDKNISEEFAKFDSWYDGIDAHTDHSALYAGVEGYPRLDSKDPKHQTSSWLFGMITTVEGLSGTWAEIGYHLKLLSLYNDLLEQ